MTEQELERIQAVFGTLARPRAVTVTGVLWLFLGVSWAVIGTLGLGGSLWFSAELAEVARETGREAPGLPLVFFWYPAGALACGVVGLHYARLALRLEERGRVGLRRVNIAAACLFASFTVNWMYSVTRNYYAFGHIAAPPSATQVGMALQGLCVGLLLAAPFLYAVRKLGSDPVRYSMRTPPAP